MRTDQRFRVVLAAVGLALLAPLPTSAAPGGTLLEERIFRLDKTGQDRVPLSVGEPGTLVVKARVKEPFATTPIHLLLEGPGGLRVEKKGAAPLRLRFRVTAETAGEAWHASVINVSKLSDVTGKLTIELLATQNGGKHRNAEPPAPPAEPPSPDALAPRAEPPAPPPVVEDPAATPAAEDPVTDGDVSYIDDRRLRAVCQDRNTDVSVRLDLEQGTGALLMRFNHVFSFAVHQSSEDLVEMRGSGRHPLLLDLAKRAIVFTTGEEGTFCRVKIYRGER